MSTKWGRKIDNFLYFGGEFPGLVDTANLPEVPMPEGIGVDRCGWIGDKWIHWDGCNCDWEYDVQRDIDNDIEREMIERDPPDPSW